MVAVGGRVRTQQLTALACVNSAASGGFGLKMLQKMGWTEGQGLGKDGSGIVEHVNIKKRADNLGLGAKIDAHGNDTLTTRLLDYNSILKQLGSVYGTVDDIKAAAAANSPAKGDTKAPEGDAAGSDAEAGSEVKSKSKSKSSKSSKKSKDSKKDKKHKKRSKSDDDKPGKASRRRLHKYVCPPMFVCGCVTDWTAAEQLPPSCECQECSQLLVS